MWYWPIKMIEHENKMKFEYEESNINKHRRF